MAMINALSQDDQALAATENAVMREPMVALARHRMQRERQELRVQTRSVSGA